MVKFYGVPNSEDTLTLKSYTETDEHYDRIPLSAVELSPEPFEANVTAIDWYRGRSAAGVMVRVDGHPSGEVIKAEMSVNRFLRLVNRCRAVFSKNDMTIFSTPVKFVKVGTAVFVEVVE